MPYMTLQKEPKVVLKWLVDLYCEDTEKTTPTSPSARCKGRNLFTMPVPLYLLFIDSQLKVNMRIHWMESLLS